MIINRQNYQIWITDYYDGQLDDFQTEVLMDFLSDNPDLRSEFEDYPDFFISPDEKAQFDNSELLRTPEQLTNDQVEHFSIALCENDLSEKQKQDIAELKKSDPRFRKSIRVYEKIRLKPDDTEYPDKALLLKIPGRRKTMGILFTSLSMAASIAIITGLFFIFNRQSPPGIDDGSAIATISESEAEQEIQERPPLLDLTDEMPRYIPAKTEVLVAESVSTPEIIEDESIILDKEFREPIIHLAMCEEIKLDDRQAHYLLAEIKPYNVPLLFATDDTSDMSVREFLAYQFRKKILEEEDPGIEQLKAWEIADAGIKGVNSLLGWNMELQTGKTEDGKLKDISFTSELIKFDHKSRKNNPGL